MPGTLHDLIAIVVRWTASRPNIVAVGIVGSHACGTASPGSDVDLVVVAEGPAPLLEDPIWPEQFGDLRSVVQEDRDLVRSLRCRYARGPEVESGPTGRAWYAPPIDPSTTSVIRDGL